MYHLLLAGYAAIALLVAPNEAPTDVVPGPALAKIDAESGTRGDAESETRGAESITGSRRYALLFGPDANVVGAVKLPPEVAVSTSAASPWIPADVPITLTAAIQHIGATEIQSVDFLLDDVSIATTSAAELYSKAYTFTAAQAGSRRLVARVTDTDGKQTLSEVLSVEIVVSQVIGSHTGVTGPYADRRITGYACSTAYSAPLNVKLRFGLAEFGPYPANLASEPAINAACKSSGTAFRFSVPVTAAMYASHSQVSLSIRAISAAPGQGEVVIQAAPGSTLWINRLPTASAVTASGLPAYSGGLAVEGHPFTLSATGGDADNDLASLQILEDGVATPLCSTSFALSPGAGTTAQPIQCPPTAFAAGTHVLRLRATDHRQVSVFSSPNSLNVLSLTPALIGASNQDPTGFVVRLDGSGFFHTVRVEAAETPSGVALFAQDIVASGSEPLRWVSLTIPAAHRERFLSSGLHFRIANRTPGHPQGEVWPANETVLLRGDAPPELVMILSPTDGASIPRPSSLWLEASASDDDGISRIEFHSSNGGLLGTAYDSPFRFEWINPPLGQHTLTARAFDTVNQFSSSLPVVVTITTPVVVGPPEPPPAPDLVSDTVGATAGQFRVTESGAASYTIPVYTVPGTAGVVPQIGLSYSSQSGDGPVGKGWSLSGLSSISRCRATREAGDSIVGGVPVDGDHPAIEFSSRDRLCLDGQRLIPVSNTPACAAAPSGFAVQQLRTELESFQRVCAYSPTAGDLGPAFFLVDRKDGSTSYYGDRDTLGTASNRPDGYVTAASSTTEEPAFFWWQTRLVDSTGNFINFKYRHNPAGLGYPGESVIDAVEYTGKIALSGQSASSAPYARIAFSYVNRPEAERSRSFVAGRAVWQTQLLEGISTIGDINTGAQARYYKLTYGTSPSGSRARTLTSVKECRDATEAVCLAPTEFTWSTAVSAFSNRVEVTSVGFDDMISHRLGDVDGDGRLDVVWFKAAGSGSDLYVSFGELNASGNQTFHRVQTPIRVSRDSTNIEKSWHLFDYDGDGRDDLFFADVWQSANSGWKLFRSLGRPQSGNSVFGTTSLIDYLGLPGIPVAQSSNNLAILADINGDALLDVIYGRAGAYRARLMQRAVPGASTTYAWGAERDLDFSQIQLPPIWPGSIFDSADVIGGQFGPSRVQTYDFDGDSRSDLLFYVTVRERNPRGDCIEERAPESAPDVIFGPASGGLGVGSTPAPAPQGAEPPQDAIGDEDCYGVTRWLVALGIEQTENSVRLIQRVAWREYEHTIGVPVQKTRDHRFADLNGDGLTDVVYKDGVGSHWTALVTGYDYFNDNFQGLGAIPNDKFLQLVDVNADGRADLVYPSADANSLRPFQVRLADARGRLQTTATTIAGGQATGCRSHLGCDMLANIHLFADFDGDANVDFAVLYADSANHTWVSGAAQDRFRARDVIERITDGLGAQTEITHRPLTLSALYGRDTGARTEVWGRGSAVQEFFTPMYVVSRARSSAPVAGDSAAMSAVHYRYAGARMQAGGRGFLGFREIRSIDASVPGQHVISISQYRRDFPFAGLPLESSKHVVSQTFATAACLEGTLSNACFQPPGTSLGAIPSGAARVSSSESHWEAAPAFSPGVQQPVFVRMAGSDDRGYDLASGNQVSHAATTFGSYDSYGNVLSTEVKTYGANASSLVSTVTTTNAYTNHVASARWRLGRMTTSSVKHARPGQPDITKHSSFGYDLSTAAATGLLTSETVQPGGAVTETLTTYYQLDEWGNRIGVFRCSSDVSAETCRTGNAPVRPGESGVPSSRVFRYARTTYDAIGRFAVATTEPFAVGGVRQEIETTRVLQRNLFGDVTYAKDANQVHTIAASSTLGRTYYAWAQTAVTAAPGTPEHGIDSVRTLRRCGTGANQVSCPAGAVYRERVVTDGAPRQWNYFDKLGRSVLGVTESFNAGVANQMFSGVCTSYDEAGRPEQVSNPAFLPSLTSDAEPNVAATFCAGASLSWTLTFYDPLGRVEMVQLPDGSDILHDYAGLTTTVIDPNGNASVQTRNALGELVSSTDATGLTAQYTHRADGALIEVRRVAPAGQGRGDIVSSFGYDGLGRKTSQNDPDSGYWQYTYNAVGEVLTQTDANNNVVTSDYDLRGRVWRRSATAGGTGTTETTAEFSFDASGKPPGSLDFERTLNGAGQVAIQRTYSYDTLGRGQRVDTLVDGRTFREETRYDALGRAYMNKDATGKWSKNEFTSRGHTLRTCDATEGETGPTCPAESYHLQILRTDARGNVTRERRLGATGPETTRTFDANFGRIETVCSGPGCNLQSDSYAFDAKGNLLMRERDLASPAGTNEHYYLERFRYDAADRLVRGWNERYQNATGMAEPTVDVNAPPPSNLTFYAEYDVYGNLCRKTSWSTHSVFVAYRYQGASGCGLPASGTGGSGQNAPSLGHRLDRIVVGTSGSELSVDIDANGNHTRGGAGTGLQKHYSYTAQNQANAIWKQNGSAVLNRARFWYGPDGARFKRTQEGIANAGTMYSLGGVEFEISASNGAISWRRPVAGVVLQTFTGATLSSGITVAAGNVVAANQLFFDHLGSTALWVGVDLAGPSPSYTVLKRFDFAPHGEARPTGAPRLEAPADTVVPWRGFTGHEHIEGVETVHMNGRIYDPLLGRFLQTDPMVQAPDNPQNWNPYAYVYNNPLSYTDPTGMFSLRQALGIVVAIVGTVFAPQFSNVWAKLGYAMAVGAASGYVSTGSMQGAAAGAFSAALFFGIGTAFENIANANGVYSANLEALGFPSNLSTVGNTGLTASQLVGKVVAHGMAGGVISSLQGGKFGHGFLSAGLSNAAAPFTESFGTVGRVITHSIVGGTASSLTGGKFANGASTAAFSVTFNDLMHGGFRASDLPALPQWVVDGATGFGDGVWSTITLGFGDLGAVRNVLGISGGIDVNSTSYSNGGLLGMGVGLAATGGAAAEGLFAASAGRHIFFSGGREAQGLARAAERLGAGSTVYSTVAGRLAVGGPDWLWKPVSFMYAATTRSAITYISPASRSTSIWARWEAPVINFMERLGMNVRRQ